MIQYWNMPHEKSTDRQKEQYTNTKTISLPSSGDKVSNQIYINQLLLLGNHVCQMQTQGQQL